MDTQTTPPPDDDGDLLAATPTLDAASCYRAVTARDTRFDGVFFTAVKTTGIYCRPVCSAKTPAASSCTFFTSAAQAENAGFRPCLRCRPELAPYALQQNLAYAVWQKICAGALNHASLDELAVEVGLSSRQLRRVLLQHFGVAPVELAQTQRLLLAKQLLTETTLPVTEIAFAAGFGSLRRFNDLFQTRYKLAPSQLRVRQRAPKADAQGITLKLAFRPPFNWPGMLDYFFSRRLHSVAVVDQSSYRRSVLLNGHSGWLAVQHDGKGNFLTLQFSTSLLPVLPLLLTRVREQFDLDANPELIRHDLHLPGRRAETVIAFARFAQAGGLQPPAGQDLASTLAQLQSLPGIGAWSANYIALRALRYPDAFPSGDLVLQKALGRILQMDDEEKRPSAKQLEKHAQRWQPWRGYAALALWHSMPLIQQAPGTEET
ncbi:MAG: DNA-3-methyladenine glycosylase 2 family protein [Burkholderiales bacterium]|nr:DNA-3-methyladenine glycosylase 2 family protein [Burkholderiales bacterium]